MSTRFLRVCALLGLTLTACDLEGGIDLAEGDAGADAGAAPETALETDPGIETSEHALFGALTFAGCNGAQQSHIRAAVNYAKGRVNTYDFRQCLRDAHGVEAEGRMPEQLWLDMSTQRAVDFSCDDGDGASTGFNATRESMRMGRAWLMDETVESLAAVIMHEIAHNHGWWHNTFYGPTWPDQVLSCLYRGQPWGARRSEQTGPAFLAPVGGEGGREYTFRCGDHEAMVGIAGAVSYGDNRLRRLRPLCQDVDGDHRVGNVWTWGFGLPANTYRFEHRCPADHVVLGIEGQAGGLVERVRAVCAPLDRLQSFPGGMTTQNLSYRGRASGLAFIRHCRNRKAATGLRVREGSLVDRAELECDDFPLDDRRDERSFSGHGGWGGSASRLECPGSMALSGIYGQPDPSTGRQATVGGRCRPASDQGVALSDEWAENVVFTERAGRTVLQEGLTRRAYCADDELLVGVTVVAGNIVRRFAAECADAESWLAGDPTRHRIGGLNIPAGESLRTFVCEPGEVAVALNVRSGALIDRLGLVCAQPDAIGTLKRQPAVGGNGGHGHEEVCGQGRAMVGLRTETDANMLRVLTGRCGRQTDEGTSAMGALHLPTVRGTNVADRIDDCPAGQVMIGLDVGQSGGLARAARALCGDEQTLRNGGIPVANPLTWRGGAPVNVVRRQCARGDVVRGLHGRRGAAQDAVGLVCGKVTLLPGDTGRGSVGFGGSDVHPLLIPEGFNGRVRIRVSGNRWLHPVLRIRRGAAPSADEFAAQSFGQNGIAIIDENLDLDAGRWFVEVGANSGMGSYSVSVTLIP